MLWFGLVEHIITFNAAKSICQIWCRATQPKLWDSFYVFDGMVWLSSAHFSNLFPWPGSAFIKRDQLNPRIKDQLRKALLSTIWPLQLPNFVSCGRDKPSHMTQNLVTVGAKLLTGEWFLLDPCSWIKLIRFDKSRAWEKTSPPSSCNNGPHGWLWWSRSH